MPRPQRCRKICSEPRFTSFCPKGREKNEAVVLSFDEFETIRLVDLEKKTHEQCAKQMEISRSTATEIYESAREKIADSIVNGRPLSIGGGNYRVCSGPPCSCFEERCKKQSSEAKNHGIPKGANIMRIAVTHENGKVFQHFGHSAEFKIYDIEDRKIISSAVIPTNGSGHGALAGFLAANKADILICGGIGGAQTALAEAGIRIFGGVTGSADEAVQALLEGRLAFNPNVRCSHHDSEHGADGHNCGDHGCGSHSCH